MRTIWNAKSGDVFRCRTSIKEDRVGEIFVVGRHGVNGCVSKSWLQFCTAFGDGFDFVQSRQESSSKSITRPTER